MIYLPPLCVGGLPWHLGCVWEVLGGSDPKLLTSFCSESLLILRFPHFAGRLCGRLCLSIRPSVSLPLSPHVSDSCAAEEGRNDSGSLEQERPTNSLFSSLCFLSPAAFCCSSALAPSHRRVANLTAFLSLSLRLSSDPNALGQHGTDHALIGGVVAVVVFVTLCLIIVLGRYLARHKGKSTAEPNWVPRRWWRQWGMLCFSLKTCEVFPQVPKVCNMPTAITLVCVISHFTHQYDSITPHTRLAGGGFSQRNAERH